MISPRAAEIFLHAQTLDPDTRARYVSEICGDNDVLLQEVTRLLDAANESGPYFERLASRVGLDALADGDEDAVEGRTLGAWRLIEQIGRGGMGAVYRAERADAQYEHQGALKILPRAFDTEQARTRFLAERQILARLVHDNIARLLDGGVTDDGVPYFVMDYIDGLPIDVYCAAGKKDIRERLTLLLEVADAVQYAHRNLVIHRDLKPSNVLVTDEGKVRLLDFGVAKILEPSSEGQNLTQAAQRPATPVYASPEMLRGDPVDVTTDVYSLGVLAYELLAGKVPLRYDDMSFAAMCEYAMREEPPQLGDHDPALRGDLDVIVAKALAKDPAARYESVESFANDVRRFLDGLPIAAKPQSAAYRLGKFIRRHRLAVSFAAFAVTSLAVIAALAVRSAIESENQARAIAAERDRLEQTREFLVGIFRTADPDIAPGEQTAIQILDAARVQIEEELAGQPGVQADLMQTMSEVYTSLRMVDASREVLERERQLRVDSNGQDSPEFAALLIRLAQVNDIAGDYEASLQHARDALQVSHGLGDELGQAAAHTRIGRVLHLQGDLDNAGPEYRKALDIYVRELGAESLQAAQSRLHLANLLNHQEDFEQALAEFQTVLEIRRGLMSGDHSEITEVLLGMGSVLGRLGRHDESMSVYRQAFEMNDRLYGPDNARNLYVANGLGKTAEAQGNLEQAIEYYEESVRLIMKHVPESPNLGFALANIGKSRLRQGRCDLAVPNYRRAVAIFSEHLPNHWALGDMRWRLGSCLAEIGAFAEAEELILSGMATVEAQWGAEHDTTRGARAAAVALYTEMQQPDKAKAYADP